MDNYQVTKTKGGFEVCYSPNKTDIVSGWTDPASVASTLPFFVFQMSLLLLANRIFLLILKPLRQPPVVAYMMSGLLLGTGGFGHSKFFETKVFPLFSLVYVETFANLAITYYMFLVGLEIDLLPVIKTGRKTFTIALSGIILPFCVGIGLFFFLFNPDDTDFRGSVFWAIALTATNFSEVTRILIDLKLLRMDIGRLASSTSIISDFCTWFLLLVALSLLNARSYFAIISTIIFLLVCLLIFRPLISSLASYFCKAENPKEGYVWFTLGWVTLFGLITDSCGSHSIIGSFIFGFIIPRGNMLRFKLMEKVDEFVTEIMMPTFFVTLGLRIEVSTLAKTFNWQTFLLVIGLCFAAKIVSTVIVCLLCRMSIRDATALGVLMNTKGVFAMIVINSARDFEALDNQTFPLIMVALLVMTSLVEPLISTTYRGHKPYAKYKTRTIQSSVAIPNTQFRILVCIYSTRDVSSMISLLEASNATKEFPISVVAFHLVEFIGRATTMFIIHNELNRNSNKASSKKSKLDRIMDAFQIYETRCNGVYVQSITTVSPYETMHKDICNLAEDKHVALLIIPFHTELMFDGKIEDPNSPFVSISQYVLESAPCSVGLLIDRGLDSLSRLESSGADHKLLRVAMVFIGGPDDREALAYAMRMASHAFVNLTVLRFLQHRDGEEKSTESIDREKKTDDDYIREFCSRIEDDDSIKYIEKAVSSGEETITSIRGNDERNDLYIIGRGKKRMRSPLTAGLSDWKRCSELGVLGDTLVSCNFTSRTSILVIQQYTGSSKQSNRRLNMTANSSPWHPLMSEARDNSLHMS